MDGKGIEKLLVAGIRVQSGLMESKCKHLNKRFFTFHSKRRPYIVLKWAQSADHKIAGIGDTRTFITNDATNRIVHKWRHEEAAIMVGTNTALADDPSLTNRLWSGSSPVRLVIDMNLRLPGSLKVFDKTAKTIVFNTLLHDEKDNLVYYKIQKDLPLARQLCDALYFLNFQSMLVEGGSRLIQTFFEENLWDEARVISNEELFIGDGIAAPQLPASSLESSTRIMSDTIKYF